MKKVCTFVDGENFRYSTNKLFPNNNTEYLPKANWSIFFDFLVTELKSKYQYSENIERLRTYWYVVENIDFIPYRNLTEEQEQLKNGMQNRFDGWKKNTR